MVVLGRHHIAKLQSQFPAERSWLALFMTELAHANWKRSHDVKANFPRASRVDEMTYDFPIGNGEKFLRIAFCFKTATAIVTEVR